MELIKQGLHSRGQVDKLADFLTEDTLSGNQDPLDAWASLKVLEEAIKQAKDRIKDAAIDELAKYGPTATINGAKLTKYNGRRFYDYSHNPDWQQLKSKMEEVERKMKIAINDTIVDEETGEVVPPAKVTHSSETISVSLS